MARRVVIGLGANLGDPRATLASAADAVEALTDAIPVARSALYRTAPVGPPQPDYVNAALALETSRTARDLLGELLAIEARFGRERRDRWAARTLDLDILWIDGEALDEGDLAVPHPRLHERAFALVPLLDVAPTARDPRTGAAYRDVLAQLTASGVTRIGGF